MALIVLEVIPYVAYFTCTLMTSQGSETVTAMFWQNGITVITRAR